MALLALISCCLTVARATAAPSLCVLALEQECFALFGPPCRECANSSPRAKHFCTPPLVASACATKVVAAAQPAPTLKLSTARRNIGAVATATTAYFAGGCVTQGKSVQFVCNNASAAIDAFDVAAGRVVAAKADPKRVLAEARGWVAAGYASAGSGSVVFAGGGTLGTAPHSRRADVLDVATGAMSTNATALSVGRWGIGWASTEREVFFTGGKVTISGYTDAFMTASVDVFEALPAPGHFRLAPFNLSQARESNQAAIVGGSLLVAGGWAKLGGKYQGSARVDVFDQATKAGHLVKNSHFDLKSDAYDVGLASMRAPGAAFELAYLADNENLLVLNEKGVALATIPLPAHMVGAGGQIIGGGTIPAAHVAHNGVSIGGVLACFYSLRLTKAHVHSKAVAHSEVLCYSVPEQRWHALNCSVPHQGGQIVALNGTHILVGGGYDPTSEVEATTDVVDVFRVSV